MRLLISALTALMLFATPVVAGDFEDGLAAAKAGDFQKAFRLWKPRAERDASVEDQQPDAIGELLVDGTAGGIAPSAKQRGQRTGRKRRHPATLRQIPRIGILIAVQLRP